MLRCSKLIDNYNGRPERDIALVQNTWHLGRISVLLAIFLKELAGFRAIVASKGIIQHCYRSVNLLLDGIVAPMRGIVIDEYWAVKRNIKRRKPQNIGYSACFLKWIAFFSHANCKAVAAWCSAIR